MKYFCENAPEYHIVCAGSLLGDGKFEVMPRYWRQTNPPYEVDFLVQQENDISPVEVKSEGNTASRSLRKFKKQFPEEVRLRIRFSLDNLKPDGDVLSIPLFMANQTERLTDYLSIIMSTKQLKMIKRHGTYFN